MASKHISLPSTFAEGDPTEWFQRYDICCTANEWDNEVKAKKLPTLLEGEAFAVWLELTAAERASYVDAKAKLIARMAPVQFVTLGDFHARRSRPGESLSVFLHELKRLLDQAMPGADADTRKQLLLHQFITGLPAHVSKQLRATGEVSDLDKVLERAKLLLTIEEQEKSAAIEAKDGPSEVEALKEQITALTEQVAALVTRRSATRPNRTQLCFRCHQPGHLQRQCPMSRGCFVCGQPGHIAKDCQSGNGRGAFRQGQGRPMNK